MDHSLKIGITVHGATDVYRVAVQVADHRWWTRESECIVGSVYI